MSFLFYKMFYFQLLLCLKANLQLMVTTTNMLCTLYQMKIIFYSYFFWILRRKLLQMHFLTHRTYASLARP